MQWSMIGLQLTVISKQWCALWCWADLSSGLNCRRDKNSNWYQQTLRSIIQCAYEPFRSFFQKRWMHCTRDLSKTTKKREKRSSHPNGHVSNIGIFWAFHEYKCRVSGILNDDFFCYFSRSYKIVIKAQLETRLNKCTRKLQSWLQTHTSSDHCDGRLDVNPFICVNTRVDKYQAVKVRLLTPSECILNGVIVLEKTSQVRSMGGGLKKGCKKNVGNS